MSDQTNTTDDTQVETTTAPVDEAPGTTTEEAPPWGDDFDPARAWNTIQQQREAERTAKAEADALRQDAEFAKALREDPNALRSFLEEQGYEFDEDDYDEPDSEPDGPTVADPRVDQLISWQQQQAAKEAEQQFEHDFKQAVGDREISDKAREFIVARTVYGGNNADALKAAVDEWFELTTPPAPKTKRAPHVPAGGPPSDPPPAGTHQDRVSRALERMQAEQAL